MAQSSRSPRSKIPQRARCELDISRALALSGSLLLLMGMDILAEMCGSVSHRVPGKEPGTADVLTVRAGGDEHVYSWNDETVDRDTAVSLLAAARREGRG